MRIITGSLKGRRLSVPDNTEVRPTTGRVKESLFSAIESRRYIQQSSVLDLFAGTGSLGFEALSRGAGQATFVDQDQKCLNYIDDTSREFEVAGKARTVRLDVLSFLAGPPVPCDIILADPPYTYEETVQIPERVFEQEWLTKEGWLVLEHSKYDHFREHAHFVQEKNYGRTYISFFHVQQTTEATK